MNPITVQTVDGPYQIPTDGAWGSWAWVRTASLISAAYRQVGDAENAKKWANEYGRRLSAYSLIEKGKDIASIIAAVGKDILQYPLDIGKNLQKLSIGAGVIAAALLLLVAKKELKL